MSGVVEHERLTCWACKGDGVVPIYGPPEPPDFRVRYVVDEVECPEPDCIGGRVACGSCGDRPADVLVGPDEYCAACAKAEASAA